MNKMITDWARMRSIIMLKRNSVMSCNDRVIILLTLLEIYTTPNPLVFFMIDM